MIELLRVIAAHVVFTWWLFLTLRSWIQENFTLGDSLALHRLSPPNRGSAMKKKLELKASNMTAGIAEADLMLFLDVEFRPRMAWGAKLRVRSGFRQQVQHVIVEWDSNNEDYPEAPRG